MCSLQAEYLSDDLTERGAACAAIRAVGGRAQPDSIADVLGDFSMTTPQVYAHIVDKMSKTPARYLQAVMRA